MLTFLKLIPLKSWLWGGLVAVSVSYHFIDRSRAVDRAITKERATVQNRALQAEVKWLDRYIDTQGMLSVLASADRWAIYERNSTIRNRAENQKKEYRDAIPTFPATTCVIDADRLRRFNDIVAAPRP